MITLEPYQQHGVHFLANRKCALLADEMGLGKSAQAIRALDHIRAKRALIFCPAIARVNWQREFEKFSTTAAKNTFILESGKDIKHWNRKDHLISSFNLAGKIQEYLAQLSRGKIFNCLLVDEAHFLKNKSAKRSKIILGKNGLVRTAHRFWAMTGTPMPNNPAELWLILKVMGRTTLSYMAFVKRFCECYGGWDMQNNRYAPLIITGAKKSAIPDLRRMLDGLMLRRKAKDYFNFKSSSQKFTLPKPKRIPPDIAALFTAEDMQRARDEKRQAMSIQTAEGLMMLSGSISTLRRLNGLLKVPGIAELVTGELLANSYQKVVIFCHHEQVSDRLAIRLTQFNPLQIHGKILTKQRQLAIDLFQNSSQHRILIAGILSAGTAINLTAGEQVIFAELDYVPANNQQALRRVLRRGVQNPVSIRSMCFADSVDERITEILKNKLDDIYQVIER